MRKHLRIDFSAAPRLCYDAEREVLTDGSAWLSMVRFSERDVILPRAIVRAGRDRDLFGPRATSWKWDVTASALAEGTIEWMDFAAADAYVETLRMGDLFTVRQLGIVDANSGAHLFAVIDFDRRIVGWVQVAERYAAFAVECRMEWHRGGAALVTRRDDDGEVLAVVKSLRATHEVPGWVAVSMFPFDNPHVSVLLRIGEYVAVPT